MAIKSANWVGENTSTIGTGNIILSGAISTFVSFSVLGIDAQVYYTIQEGFNRETGIAVVNDGFLTRQVQATLFNGVYLETSTPIPLYGNAQVFAVINSDFATRLYNASVDIAADVQAAADSAAQASESATLALDYQTQAEFSATDAEASALSAFNSKNSANTSASLAEGYADDALNSATNAGASAAAAADSAASINPSNFLLKSNNLSDVANKATSLSNLLDDKPLPLPAGPVADTDAADKKYVDENNVGFVGDAKWYPARLFLPGGRVAADGQLVSRTGAYASLWAEVAAGRLPTVIDAQWISEKGFRGFYSFGDGDATTGTTFRIPDYNGRYSGSISAPVMRGDGAGNGTSIITNGTIQQNAAPNIQGSARLGMPGTGDFAVIGSSGAMTNTNYNPQVITSVPGGVNKGPANSDVGINASLSNAAYGRDGTTEVRMNAIYGCYAIQYAGVANNAGSIDALALSNRIEQVAQSVTAVGNRISYALITTSTNIALNSRMVLQNPFGNAVPVVVMCEIFHVTLQKWVAGAWVYISNTSSFGLVTYYSDGEGIVLRSAKEGFISGNGNGGGSQEFTSNYVTLSPVRIHVWKVTQ